MPQLTINEKDPVTFEEGAELTKIAERHPELPLKFGCRRGRCGVCAIRIVEGGDALTKQSEEERDTLRRKGLPTENYRLGCQCALNGSAAIATAPDAS